MYFRVTTMLPQLPRIHSNLVSSQNLRHGPRSKASSTALQVWIEELQGIGQAEDVFLSLHGLMTAILSRLASPGVPILLAFDSVVEVPFARTARLLDLQSPMDAAPSRPHHSRMIGFCQSYILNAC